MNINYGENLFCGQGGDKGLFPFIDYLTFCNRILHNFETKVLTHVLSLVDQQNEIAKMLLINNATYCLGDPLKCAGKQSAQMHRSVAGFHYLSVQMHGLRGFSSIGTQVRISASIY